MSKSRRPEYTPEELAERRARLIELETTIAMARGHRPNGDVSRFPACVQALPPPKESRRGRTKQDASPTDVYRLYNAAGELLYVGISLTVAERLGAHRQGPWWSEVATIEVDHEDSRSDALAAEAAQIKTLCPRYNVQGAA